MGMDRENGVLKYVQLKDILLKQMADGTLKPGDKFCTQNELMEKFSLSFATVTHALRDMTKAGYLVRKKGQGTFVASHPDLKAVAKTQFNSAPLFIVGNAFNYKPEDQAQGHLSWFVFDEMQKGIVNSYAGPVRFVSMQELTSMPKARAILLNPTLSELEALNKIETVFIAIDHGRELRLRENSVSWEMMFGICDTISYLALSLKHRKIAYIGGDMPKYFADRYAAYEIGLRANLIPLREEYVIRGLRGYERDGYDAMKKLLALPEPPTAVFADTDLKAFGAIKAAQEAGLNVPADISIAGFDDMPGSSSFAPPLTCVKIPYYEMGVKAVELLRVRAASGKDVASETMKSRLVERESCAKSKETL